MVSILRLPIVKAQTGASRSTIYLRIQQGLWPKPVRLGPRSVGWPAGEVAAINAARISGKSDEEIRALVVDLEAARKLAGVRLAGECHA
ncbi:MAG: transcriptional regulator [Hydrogenophilales bacterium 28-61-23]|nr:MAG: transcriptional regulator [Hydrogenophilales bacterium 28-61-23]